MTTPRVVVIVHVFYADLWSGIADCLANIPADFDLCVNIVSDIDSPSLRSAIHSDFPIVRLSVSPNRGYDIGGLFASLKLLDLTQYDLICKVHTKKGAHLKFGDDWRRSMLQTLLGSAQTIREIWRRFAADPHLGMVGDARFRFGADLIGMNRPHYTDFCNRLGIDPDIDNLDFFGGTMFWCRPRILTRLLELDLDVTDFEAPPDARTRNLHDGQMAHAIERLVGRICTAEDLDIAAANRLRFCTAANTRLLPDATWLKDQIHDRMGDVECISFHREVGRIPALLIEQLQQGIEFVVYLAPTCECFVDPRAIVNALADCNVLVVGDADGLTKDPSLLAVRACEESMEFLRTATSDFEAERFPGVRIVEPRKTGLGLSTADLRATQQVTVDQDGRLFFDGTRCSVFRWPDDSNDAYYSLLQAGRNTRGLRFLLKAFSARECAIRPAEPGPARSAQQLPTLLRQRLRDYWEDLGLGLSLLKREGYKKFVYRCYWYVRGRQLPHELPEDIGATR